MSKLISQIEFVAIGSIIIDDIVDPQGRSTMGVLGGGGSHAVAGMRVWSEQTALVSVMGQDFPQTAWAQLESLANTNSIIERPVVQPRAWQLFETDGTRHEIFRTDFAALRETTIRADEYPLDLATAKGIYLQTATAAEAEIWATHLRKLNPTTVILWEPWEILYKPENLVDFCRVAPQFDIISPQVSEVCRMIDETRPEKQAYVLFECGVRCLALRMGAAGSWVGTSEQNSHIPAMPVPVIDETGAGNSYCGGFVVGYVESGGDPVVAGRYGAVSATFALAQLGLARLGKDTSTLAETRLHQLQEQAG